MRFWRYISLMIPECSFKENLRIIFHKWMAKKLPVPLKKLELLGDEGLYLELGGDLKLVSEVYPRWNVLGLLQEQLVDRTYYTKFYGLKKGDTVVDAGANIGVFTVLAAKSVGDDGKLIAIEPEKKNVENLRKNIEINGLNNVAVVPKGLWNRRSKKRLYLTRGSTGHSLVQEQAHHTDLAGHQPTDDKTEEIETDTLDNILEELGVSKVDFIKMDIEGAEIQALDGMKRTLKTNDVKLAIAAYHIVNGAQTCKIVTPWLEKAGFDVHEEEGFVYVKKLPEGER